MKAGIAFDATFFGTLLGFAIIKPLSRLNIPIIGGSFGPKEHSLIQTVATASGGLSTLFIASVPAMFQLGVLDKTPSDHYQKLVSLTAASAFFGTMMAVPLRKIFINILGRELRLVFPSATAVATMIRYLHLGAGTPELKKLTMTIAGTLTFSLVWVVATSYCKGILFDWYPMWWIYVWGNYSNRAIHAVNWGLFVVEWSPAFIGVGFLIPLNAGVSWVLGYILAYGIIGPILVAKGMAVGIPISERYPELKTYMAVESADYINQPSPRYWALWPALFCMIAVSLFQLAFYGKSLFRAIKISLSSGANSLNDIARKTGHSSRFLEKRGQLVRDTRGIDNGVLPNDLPRWWEFWSFLVAGFVLAVVILSVKFVSPDPNLSVVAFESTKPTRI